MVRMALNTTAMEIAIREIELADADEVSQLVAQLGYERSPAEIREWTEALRREHRQQAAFAAVLGGEILGWVEISVERRLQSPPFALIGGLVVKNSMRNRGIGRQLCARAEAWAWERSLDKVRVTSRSTRADAHRFYLRDGYREVKTSMVFEKNRPR